MSVKLSKPPTCDHCSRTAKWIVTVDLSSKGLGPVKAKLCGKCAGKYPRRYRTVLKQADW